MRGVYHNFPLISTVFGPPAVVFGKALYFRRPGPDLTPSSVQLCISAVSGKKPLFKCFSLCYTLPVQNSFDSQSALLLWPGAFKDR